MTYDGDGNLAYELDYNVDAVVDGRCIYFPTHGTKAERELYKKVCDGYGWVRGDYTLTEYLNDVTRENVEVLAEYGRNYCSVTVYTYGNERIAATTFNGYGYHFGCHDHGYHNIFNHYEKWHDRWHIKDRWHNNHHGNRPRGYEGIYSNADKFKATYGSYSSYHSGKYCGHKWKTAMSKIYYLYDGHGSVERVHGKDGSTFRLEYDTYVNLVAGIVEKWHVWYNDIFAHRTANIYAYSGERYNVISGLQFLRARWYDTNTGRFISEDSYLGTQVEPLSRNRYIYTVNNPVNYIDPSGHIPVETILDLVSAVGSLWEVLTNPFSLGNWLSLGWDVASIVVPYVPGSYVAKGANAAGNVLETAKDVEKTTSYIDEGMEIAEEFIEELGEKCGEFIKDGKPLEIPFEINLQFFASDVSDDFAEEIVEEAMEETAEKAVKEATEKAAKEGAEEVVEQATKEVAEETAEAAVKGGSNFRNQDLLDSHYNKHGSEFGNITKEQYLQGANDLVNSTSDDILTKTRANGDIIYYNPLTNEFAVKSADGYIRTYFKPSDGLDYFNRQ